MEEISQELALRMAAAVRERVHSYRDWDTDPPNHITEMRAIVALLPEPPDPDEAAAREIVNKHLRDDTYGTDAMFLELVRRGRELAKARAGEGSV